ncbi:MAG: type II toxin-antitoxin system Phd/YefM family antitoxin [Spirochaetaceae bacterium]|nr:MAG: type II toxin-antitoxin system Phd/YefM family antitoxin [Spirochaetaceae bacterium]
MIVSATELRQNLYRIIDSVLVTGESVEIKRKGGTVRIVPDTAVSIWDRLEVHDVITGEIEAPWDDIWDGEPELGEPEPDASGQGPA